MYTLQISLLAVLAVIASAQYDHEEHKEPEHYAPAPFKYSYGVHDPHTGDVKEAEETSDGHTVKGYYSLKDADGTTREVHYTADKHLGFVAHVNKIGIPHYPEVHHAPQIHQEPEHQYDIYAAAFPGYQPPAADHDFHIIHDKHHAKSHQSVKIEEQYH